MNIKPLHTIAAIALLLAAAGPASAGSIYRNAPTSLSAFSPHLLPVLVKVNDQGKVTSMMSAIELKPRFKRLMRETLDEMITGPAHDTDRSAIASQFIVNMASKATPRDDGKYDFQFVYVSMQPVPPGHWYWGHIDGRRLALLPKGNRSNNHWNYYHPSRQYVPPVRTTRQSNMHTASTTTHHSNPGK